MVGPRRAGRGPTLTRECLLMGGLVGWGRLWCYHGITSVRRRPNGQLVAFPISLRISILTGANARIRTADLLITNHDYARRPNDSSG